MPNRSLTPFRSLSIDPFQPRSPFLSFYRQANRLFEDVFREYEDPREALGGLLSPHIDIAENTQEIRITAELPGVKEEDIDVSLEGDLLTIRAEKRVEREEDKGARHMSERVYGTFQRSLRLPQARAPDQGGAHSDRAVLTTRLARTEAENGRRRIAIGSGPPPAPETGPQSKH